MTLEVEYPNGDRETFDAQIYFHNKEKTANIDLSKPLPIGHDLVSMPVMDLNQQIFYHRIRAFEVKRKSDGVKYSGKIRCRDKSIVRFLLV